MNVQLEDVGARLLVGRVWDIGAIPQAANGDLAETSRRGVGVQSLPGVQRLPAATAPGSRSDSAKTGQWSGNGAACGHLWE